MKKILKILFIIVVSFLSLIIVGIFLFFKNATPKFPHDAGLSKKVIDTSVLAFDFSTDDKYIYYVKGISQNRYSINSYDLGSHSIKELGQVDYKRDPLNDPIAVTRLENGESLINFTWSSEEESPLLFIVKDNSIVRKSVAKWGKAEEQQVCADTNKLNKLYTVYDVESIPGYIAENFNNNVYTYTYYDSDCPKKQEIAQQKIVRQKGDPVPDGISLDYDGSQRQTIYRYNDATIHDLEYLCLDGCQQHSYLESFFAPNWVILDLGSWYFKSGSNKFVHNNNIYVIMNIKERRGDLIVASEDHTVKLWPWW